MSSLLKGQSGFGVMEDHKGPISTNQWKDAWNIYQVVYLAAHPQKWQGLGVHFANVSRLMADKGDWVSYDIGFRRMVENGFCVWGDTHSSMYQKAMPKVNAPYKKHESQNTYQKQPSQSVPKGWCIDFHSKSECSRPQCRFNHKCFLCGTEHPATSCDKKGKNHSFRRRGNRGSQGDQSTTQ